MALDGRSEWAAQEDRGPLRWEAAPAGGILSQMFVATVWGILGGDDPGQQVLCRWVMARWQGTSADVLAEHFGLAPEDVQVALWAARDMLSEQADALLRVLCREEADVLWCLRNYQATGHSAPPMHYATWKFGLAPGQCSDTLALPPVCLVSAGQAAQVRLRHLLDMLGRVA